VIHGGPPDKFLCMVSCPPLIEMADPSSLAQLRSRQSANPQACSDCSRGSLSSRSLFVVAKQLFLTTSMFSVTLIPAVSPQVIEPLCLPAGRQSRARGFSLAFDGRIELAFGCHLSVTAAFRVTRVLLLGYIGIGIRDQLTRAT
jgi:hypothetical protein